ncbi:MAG: hypothetical protein GY833_22905 [Aestuariibacter sp.]|nr:hypothetical protein [Aestuariibacter sp.]|tara:strand:+ start:192774 stop:193049 length:276 start_codon:yes stop_codon:yes gene_type:complete
MSNNAVKTDALMRQLNQLAGVYCQPLARHTTKLEHKRRANEYAVTINIDAEQIGGGGDVRHLMECTDELKLVPMLVFVDPSELKDGKITQA